MSDSAEKSSAWKVTPDRYLAETPPRFGRDYRLTSRYVAVRDGTRLAVDVHLPEDAAAGEALPTLLIFTPYYRRFDLKPGSPAGVEVSPNTGHYRDFFIPHGYAVVVVDVRGTGASFGTRDGFRSPAERNDYYDVADWVVCQPWCDGKIGSTGISYVGAAADFLATTGHPAVRAVAPTFAVWDTWVDHFYLGGLLLNFLPPAYNALMLALDLDDREALRRYAYFADPHLDGPARVDEDGDGSLRAAAVAEHAANVDANDFIRAFAYRDTPLSYDPDYTSAAISPYSYAGTIDPDTAYYCISGWMDGGGYGNAAVKRFLALKTEKKHLLIGPWDHGARTNVSPFRRVMAPEFRLLAECLRFFDHYLKGKATGLDREKPVHYFTMAEEAWKAADDWPVAKARPRVWYLAAEAALAKRAAKEESADAYRADHSCGTGANTRYERLAAKVVEKYYKDWHGRDARMLTYTTSPLESDAELTGHAVVTLHVASTERDGGFHVYLEDVAPDGTCRYVTEGSFRARHRKTGRPRWNEQVVGPYHSFREKDARLLTPGRPTTLTFSLFPTSWLFRAGHQIRVAIAAADRDHFARVPEGRIPLLKFFRGGKRASKIELPLVRR